MHLFAGKLDDLLFPVPLSLKVHAQMCVIGSYSWQYGGG